MLVALRTGIENQDGEAMGLLGGPLSVRLMLRSHGS